MFNIKEHFSATSINETIRLLQDYPGAKLIAGGTDLLVKMRKASPKCPVSLISLREIVELSQIYLTETGNLSIGATVTFDEICNNELILEKMPFLAQVAATIGGPQLRNMATVGGNLCSGAPSADSAPALLALDARLELIGPQGKRLLDVKEFFLGPFQVDLRDNEILSCIIIPLSSERALGGYYYKYSMRNAMDIATLSCASVCEIDAKNCLKSVRIALGTAAPTPIRCFKAERFAEGQQFSKELLERVALIAQSEAKPRSSWRASKEYRLHLVKVLVARTLKQAYLNAGGVI